MDKRLSIALLLTAIIVAVTPILFPTPRRATTTTTSSRGDSTHEAAANEAASVVTRDRRAAVAVVTDSAARSMAGTTPGIAPQISTISTVRSTYQFSNIGAAPVSVVMKDYRNLSPAKGVVNLAVPGRSLIRYSLVLQGDTIPLEGTAFQASESVNNAGGKVLTYRATINEVPVAISYDVSPDKYVVKISGQVKAGASRSFMLIDMPSGLPVTEADTLGDLRTRSYSFKPSHANARGVPFGKLDPGEKRLEGEPITWVAVRNKYFVVGLINPEGSVFEEMTLTGGPRTSKIATNASAVVVKAVKNDAFAFDMYVGPQQSNELLSLGRDFDHVNPYGWSFLQPVVNPIAALCIKLLLWMHDHLKLSYGWVLVIFGVFIRIALWPLNQSAMRSSLKMQEIQPRLAEVQKKYKDDPERQRTEMMKVYKEAGASPFTALSGCLPMLIPMPVLFALFFVFQNTIEFRGVPFLWLADISIKDPFYILPVLMGVSMYLLSWIGLRNAPPNPQAKMMSYMFPVMMTFVLANMASGLNLYYTAQNLAALPQQWMLAKERQRAKRAG
jgi:YidC/Oxa1 family membrane protein insertase